MGSQQNDGGFKAFIASVALEPFRRVQLVSGSGVNIEYAGADEEFIGVTQQAAAALEQVTVKLRGMNGTFKIETAGAVVVGATIYGATNGRVDDTAAAQAIGTALEVASAAGSVIECVFDALATSSMGGSVGMVDRYALIERFEKAPTLNADQLPAGGTNPTGGEWALFSRSNKDFELLGGGAASANSVPDVKGGVLLTTAGTDGNGMFILPHLDTAQSAWATTEWSTDKSVEWECVIQTGASITSCIIWAGLKLTNTDVIITDADQAFFRYEDAVNSGKFQLTASNTGTDDTEDSGVTVVLATQYHLQITIDELRVPRFWINGALVGTLDALKTGINLIPYICVEEDGASSALTLAARMQAISRLY